MVALPCQRGGGRGDSGNPSSTALPSPSSTRDGVVHATKADAEADKEHFDGKTTE